MGQIHGTPKNKTARLLSYQTAVPLSHARTAQTSHSDTPTRRTVITHHPPFSLSQVPLALFTTIRHAVCLDPGCCWIVSRFNNNNRSLSHGSPPSSPVSLFVWLFCPCA